VHGAHHVRFGDNNLLEHETAETTETAETCAHGRAPRAYLRWRRRGGAQPPTGNNIVIIRHDLKRACSRASGKQLSSTMSSTTMPVTILQGASQDSASSQRKRPSAKLCEKCNRISVYANTHCRKCREELEMTNPCPSCRKHELKPGYKQCFLCHQKGEKKKRGDAKIAPRRLTPAVPTY
jgi:hypothetical protein